MSNNTAAQIYSYHTFLLTFHYNGDNKPAENGNWKKDDLLDFSKMNDDTEKTIGHQIVQALFNNKKITKDDIGKINIGKDSFCIFFKLQKNSLVLRFVFSVRNLYYACALNMIFYKGICQQRFCGEFCRVFCPAVRAKPLEGRERRPSTEAAANAIPAAVLFVFF